MVSLVLGVVYDVSVVLLLEVEASASSSLAWSGIAVAVWLARR
jgi:hypothetical protein